MIQQNQRIQNVHSKMDERPSGDSIGWDLASGQIIAKNLQRVQWLKTTQESFAQCFFSKKETTACASDASEAVATNITQIGLPVVRTELLNWNRSLSVLAICDTEPSISFVDKSIVSTLYLQSRKASVSVVRIHLSQYFKTEMAPTMISALKKFSLLTTVQTCVHEKLKLDDQIVDLQELRDRSPHLKNAQNQSYNLTVVPVNL